MATSSSSPFRHDTVIVGTAYIPTTPIIGREEELRQVLALLDRDDVRVLTLLGPGGVGKTRLAMEAARIIAPHFAHGACYVSLETVLDPGLVPKAVAQALGFRESVEHSAPDLLADVLADRHMLLVLDNLEQVIHASMWISYLIVQAPRLKILVTSRIPLHISGEQQFQVPTLPDSNEGVGDSAAVDLFVQRAKAVNLAFSPDDQALRAIAEICRKLDGLPLAIEMASAWMKVLSPETLLDRLDVRLSMLSGRSRDMHPRLQSMAQAIGWSYDLLSASEQVFLCRVSTFVGGFTLEAAEFVAAWPEPAGSSSVALEMVQSLVDQNLVQVVPGAGHPDFRMLETIREYGLHRIQSGDDDLAFAAHAEYYRALAERAGRGLVGPDQAAWLDRLESEYSNIRLAKTWLDEHGRLDDAIELNAHIQFFQNIRGHTAEALHRLAGWMERPELRERTQSRALVLMGMGRLLQNTGELHRSVSMLREAVEIFRDVEEIQRAAIAQGMLASAYALMGVPEAAITEARKAIEMARPLGIHRTVCSALSVLAWYASLSGDDAQSRELHEESLRTATEGGDRWAMSFNLVHLAQDALDAGRTDDARQYAEEWRQLLEDLGSLHDLPNAWAMLAWVERRAGNLDAAAEQLEKAMSIAIASGNRRLVTFLTMRKGIIATERGRFTEAAALLTESVDQLGDRPQVLDLAETLDAFVVLATKSGNFIQGARFLGASGALIRQAGMKSEHLEFDAAGYRQRPHVVSCLGSDIFERELATGAEWSVGEAIGHMRAFRPPDEGSGDVDRTSETMERVGLSPREMEVLRHMANGLSNQQIADTLYLSLRTVTTHVTRILDKLRVTSRTAAVSFAIRNGMV